GEVLRQAVAAARRLLDALAAWPERASVLRQVEHVRALCAEQLAWPSTREGERAPEWLDALEGLASAGGELEVTREELMLLFASEVEELGAGALGGSGGGVQLLDAAHARGLTFEALFVVGVNRDRFPRIVREDALLPDAARAPLLAALPDLPLKRRGFDEERYLFAELCDAAPRVTLSWQRADDDGKALSVSPLVERLRLVRGIGQPGADGEGAAELALVRVPRLRNVALDAPFAGGRPRPRTARDLLQLAGLAGGRGRLVDLFGLAFEHGVGLARDGAIALASARAQIVEEYDPDLRTRDGRRRRRLPGPYFGLIGGSAPEAPEEDVQEPSSAVYITTLEQLARCPWQTFLSRVMRLEPPPDPLAALPTIDALLLGTTVHRVLDDLVGSGPSARNGADATAPRSLQEAQVRGSRATRRPDDEAVVERCRAVAREVSLEAGLHLPGLHGALAAIAEPYVQRALEIDWPLRRSRVDVLGGELEVVAVICDASGVERRIACKADRVDMVRGSPRITDYKTGRPLSRGKRSSTRHKHLRRAVAGGRALQAAAYAASTSGDGVGRYLYVRPDLDARISELDLPADDEITRDLFPMVAAELLAGFEEGAFFPRLEDERGEEPRSCSYCQVADACLRGDSSARRRLAEIVARAGDAGLAAPPLERRLRALWRLGLEDDE
ncbi:MAG: PD-(D/E)XK nuclease family protein, partial [Myxococcales bacterium]|nr:PD-(D/E)XK nuclease family protein [Myxococcales bacterium]